MFVVTGSEPATRVTRPQLWQGLLLKAELPMPFVPAITACRVLSRSDHGLVREIVLRGAVVRERVTFHAPDRVRFDRIGGPVRGRIENRIEEGLPGALELRFTFALQVDGMRPGSPEEEAYAALMGGSYLAAVRRTLEATEALFDERGSRRAGVDRCAG